jgi:hypothetical protein
VAFLQRGGNGCVAEYEFLIMRVELARRIVLGDSAECLPTAGINSKIERPTCMDLNAHGTVRHSAASATNDFMISPLFLNVSCGLAHGMNVFSDGRARSDVQEKPETKHSNCRKNGTTISRRHITTTVG